MLPLGRRSLLVGAAGSAALFAAPASAKHHQGEPPEQHHRQNGKAKPTPKPDPKAKK